MSTVAELPGCHPVTAAVSLLHEALDPVTDAPTWSLSDGAVAEAVSGCAAAIARAQELLVRLVGAADSRGLGTSVGAASTDGWVRAVLNVTCQEARQLVTVARATSAQLTATGAALAAGTVNWAQAVAITKAVSDLPPQVGEEIRRRVERDLLDRAAKYDASQLARIGRYILEVVAPEVGEALTAAQLARDEERAARRRELFMTSDGQGSQVIRGRLPDEAAALVRAALDPLSAPRPRCADGRDSRSAGERRADALVELARRALRADDLPDAGGQPTQVVVTMPLRALTEGLGTALLSNGQPLSPAAARRLACDCQLIPAVLGSAGAVLDVGRAQRLFGGARRRALILRDRGCAFPGCDRPASWCDGHHILSWHEGGDTSVCNGVLLCGHHHDVVHRDGWAIQLARDGVPEFVAPAWIDPTLTPRRNWRHD